MFRTIVLLYLIFFVQTSSAQDLSIKDERATSNAYQSSATVIDQIIGVYKNYSKVYMESSDIENVLEIVKVNNIYFRTNLNNPGNGHICNL